MVCAGIDGGMYAGEAMGVPGGSDPAGRTSTSTSPTLVDTVRVAVLRVALLDVPEESTLLVLARFSGRSS